MQMIADDKIKDGTKIKIVGRFANGVDKYFDFKKSSTFEIYDKEKGLYDVGKWTGHVTLHDLINYSFEILEDKTEEIKEISKITKEEFERLDKRTLLELIVKNQNKIIDKLNKPIDTSKETNCMSE